MRINSIFAIPVLCIAANISTIHAGQAITIPSATHHYAPDITTCAIPDVIHHIIKEFNDRKAHYQPPRFQDNRFMLHGPHGTGKDIIVKYVADKTKSKLLRVSPGDLWRYNGGFVERLSIALKKEICSNPASIVVFFNDVDNIFSPQSSFDLNPIIISAIRKLLDKLEHTPRILFAFSHHLNAISPELIDRFAPEHIIHVPCPNDDQRKHLLQHFFVKHFIPELPYELLISRIDRLRNHSETIQEYFNADFEDISQTAYQLEKSLYDNQPDLAKKQRQHALLASLQEKNRAILVAAQESKFSSDAKAIDIVKKCCGLIDRHSDRVEKYLTKSPEQLSEQHLTWLTQNTAGLSIRDLQGVIVCIGKRIENNNGVITEAILQESLKIIKDHKIQIANNVAKQERSQKRKEIIEEQ